MILVDDLRSKNSDLIYFWIRIRVAEIPAVRNTAFKEPKWTMWLLYCHSFSINVDVDYPRGPF